MTWRSSLISSHALSTDRRGRDISSVTPKPKRVSRMHSFGRDQAATTATPCRDLWAIFGPGMTVGRVAVAVAYLMVAYLQGLYLCRCISLIVSSSPLAARAGTCRTTGGPGGRCFALYYSFIYRQSFRFNAVAVAAGAARGYWRSSIGRRCAHTHARARSPAPAGRKLLLMRPLSEY